MLLRLRPCSKLFSSVARIADRPHVITIALSLLASLIAVIGIRSSRHSPVSALVKSGDSPGISAIGSASGELSPTVKEGWEAWQRIDYNTAFRLFQQGALSGDGVAMLMLGESYREGHGVPQDYQQARQWYEKAVAAGNADAMNNLGYLYHFGHGVPQDYHQAREWYDKSAAAGTPAAMNNLGVLYDDGLGVSRDYQQARLWYDKAAAREYAMAMYNIGFMYEQGRGVPEDYQQARQWYEKAVARGNEDGKRALQRLSR